MKINKALFPIAGLGTRFLPVTKASPKEMLPIVDKPLIQYAIEEAYNAGIRQMIFITGRGKRAVEDHFDTAIELEIELENSYKYELLSLVRGIKPADMDCIYIRQPQPLGLGHAILCAKNCVNNEPFAILLADDLMISKKPVLSQMIEQFEKYEKSIIAIQNIPKEHVSRYGIVQTNSISSRVFEIKDIIEKPRQHETNSTLGVVGRYILKPSIFKFLESQSLGINCEIQLTDSISQLLAQEPVYAYKFQGKRYDCGSKLGYLQATVEIGMTHQDVGIEFKNYLQKLLPVMQT